MLTIPTIASRTDADAAVRLVLEDLGHFATKRKARVGDDVLLVLDEFSAVQGGTDQAIHLAERLRDVGVPVVFGAQSPEGLGDERQQWRLLHTIGGGLVLHQTARPRPPDQLAGTVGPPSRPGSWMPGGQPAKPGSTWPTGPGLIPTRSANSTPARPSSSRAAAPSNSACCKRPCRPGAGGGQRPAGRGHERGRAGLCRRGHRRRPTPGGALAAQPAGPRPARPAAPMPALEAPRRPRPATEPAATPALPALPRQRILLALRQAIAHHDQALVAAIVQAGQREQPGWDPTAELDRLQAVRRWRAGGASPCSRGSWPGSPTLGGCAVAERPGSGAAAGPQPDQQQRQQHQRHPNATNATRFLHADTPLRSVDRQRPQVCPADHPRWPTRTMAQLRAGRGSASPLRCRLGTLHPAGPADLLADRRIAARPLQGQGRSVPPSGPVLPPLRDALRAPLTPPRPARSDIKRRPRWARNSRPASSKGR